MGPKRFYIRREVELERFGYTPVCQGCQAAEAGAPPKNQTEVCRSRIAEEMRKDQEMKRRLAAAEERQGRRRLGRGGSALASGTGEALTNPERDSVLASGTGRALASPERSSAPARVLANPERGSALALRSGGASGSTEEESQRPRMLESSRPRERPDTGAGFGPMDEDELPGGQAGQRRPAEEPLEEGKTRGSPQAQREEGEDETMADVGELLQSLGFAGAHVAELFSPGRATAKAATWGLNLGHAFDLTLVGEDGQPWDLSRADRQRLCEGILAKEKPILLIGSPMCRAFSNLMNFAGERLHEHRAL
jgi:hypothetical protein